MFEMINVFTSDAFSLTSLTSAVSKRPYQPDFLGSLGIFTRQPITTIDAAVIIDDQGTLKLVQTTERGAPPIEQVVPARNMRSFRTPRIALGDTIRSHELQGMLARTVYATNGSVSDPTALMVQSLAAEIAYRLDGPTGLRSKVETTKEHMRLGAIAGIVLDADGSTLYDWPALFGVSLPSEIDFDLDNATPAVGALDDKIRDTKRKILRAAKAGNAPATRVIALCGDEFFDALVKHADVISAYGLYTAGALARFQAPNPNINPFEAFPFGGIDWINYRGTDDNSTVAIGSQKCKFIPVGVPGLFQEILAPGESFEYANTRGLPEYVMTIADRDRNQWFRIEEYSYPMYIATRPECLFSGRMT